jgi:hypothetical protein
VALDPVDVRFIGEPEAKRALRRRLHSAAAAAASRAQRLTNGGLACAIWWRAAQIAGDWQFARVSEEQLEDVIRGLTALFIAANAFGRVESAND